MFQCPVVREGTTFWVFSERMLWGTLCSPTVNSRLWYRHIVFCHRNVLILASERKKCGKKESEVTQSCATLCNPMDCSHLPFFFFLFSFIGSSFFPSALMIVMVHDWMLGMIFLSLNILSWSDHTHVHGCTIILTIPKFTSLACVSLLVLWLEYSTAIRLLQGDPTSPFWRRSALGFLWKEWC